MSSKCYGGVVVLSRAHAKWRLAKTRFFLSYVITRPVCNDICLTTGFNSNILVIVTEHADGTTVFDHVIEDKGRKIKAIFNILDGPRREQVLPAETESQLEPAPERHPKIQSELGSAFERQSMLQSEYFPETQPEIEDALQPETQLDPLHEEIIHAVEEVEKIKSVRDRLGNSVTYLDGLLKIGDALKDVSHSFQTRPPADYKCSCRSTRSLAFP